MTNFLEIEIALLPVVIILIGVLAALRSQVRAIERLEARIVDMNQRIGFEMMPAVASEDIGKGELLEVQAASLTKVLPFARVAKKGIEHIHREVV